MKKALILAGDGLNCEEETKAAFRLAGAETEIVHILDLLEGRKNIMEFHILAFAGGFSSGDHLGSGTILANRFRTKFAKPLLEFIEDKKLIIGICNGFQTLVRLGLLPMACWEAQSVSLSFNDSGKFEDRWVHLKASSCIWTRGIDTLYLPIRHKEGKLLSSKRIPDQQIALQYIDQNTGQPTQSYPANPNGSDDAVAGICDPTGHIFGLMPHPEAFLFPYQHPTWMRRQLPDKGEGLKIFQNAIDYSCK